MKGRKQPWVESEHTNASSSLGPAFDCCMAVRTHRTQQQQQQPPSARTFATAPRCDQQPLGRASAGAAAAAGPAAPHPAGLWLGHPPGTQALPSETHGEAHGRLDLQAMFIDSSSASDRVKHLKPK